MQRTTRTKLRFAGKSVQGKVYTEQHIAAIDYVARIPIDWEARCSYLSLYDDPLGEPDRKVFGVKRELEAPPRPVAVKPARRIRANATKTPFQQ